MKDSPQPAKRRRYDAAFQAEDLRLAEQSRSVSQRGLSLWAYQDIVSKHVMVTMPEELITTALQCAFWAQPPTSGSLVHSDRSGQYCGNTYRKLLHDHQAMRSQSHRGDCYNNAQAESLWSRLKTEVLEVHERLVFADLVDV